MRKSNFPRLLILTFLVVGAFIALTTSVSAQVKDYLYDSVTVDIDVNKDSTAVITEELTYRFTGQFRGVFREITLSDSEAIKACKENDSLQCGGFEYLQLLEVYDEEGNVLPESAYRVFETSDSGENRLRIEWVFSESGQVFDNETFKFGLKYKVYGSFGYFDDYDLLYWDAIFPDRDKLVKEVKVNIHFPSDIKFVQENLDVLGRGFTYTYEYDKATNTLLLATDNLAPYEDYTVVLKIPKGIIDEYATLVLDLSPATQSISINGVLRENIEGSISGIVPGTVNLVFSSPGYIDKELVLDLKPGEIRNLEVVLEATAETKLFLLMLAICNVLGCMILPVGIILVYLRYRMKGRDLGKSKVIYPQYSPPENIRPYLLGSINDEKVDPVDITATIIDAAYRGFIKIREFESKVIFGLISSGKDYELIKLKEFTELTPSEQKILTGIFGGKERVTVSTLNLTFYSKVKGIQDAIYAEMVSRGYFNSRPDQVRERYTFAGCGVVAFGLVMLGVLFLLPVTLSAGLSLFIVGIVLLIVGQFMPAKTMKGGKIYSDILGFKMYMYTAERFRVQDLTPETFEKYLAYAMVFGIEKQWGERFKDIYKKPPEWFEANKFDPTSWNTITLVNALSNFSSVTTAHVASTGSSSSSWSSRGFSGGGWSGGGGFSGGFSGGGGGGGGGGAF